MTETLAALSSVPNVGSVEHKGRSFFRGLGVGDIQLTAAQEN